MIRLTLILIFLCTNSVWSQVTVTGTVIFKGDNSPLPGIYVIEKGTHNGTTSKFDGTFSLVVSNPNSTLLFSFLGMKNQEYQLKGERQLLIKMKEDCIKDFFDSQRIALYASSGVINTPIGGQVEVESPYIFNGVIKGSYGFQTNLSANQFQNIQIELSHFISNCDFDIDFKGSSRKVSFNDDLKSNVYSFETDLNLRRIKLIAGYAHLDLNRINSTYNENSSGLLVGFGTYFRRPFHPVVIGKISFFKDNIEYQANIQGGYKRLLFFIKFYKLNSFNELSLGVGTRLGYRLKKQRN